MNCTKGKDRFLDFSFLKVLQVTFLYKKLPWSQDGFCFFFLVFFRKKKLKAVFQIAAKPVYTTPIL